MWNRIVLTLSIFNALTALYEASSLSCTTVDTEKVDCGYAGIDESGCNNKGCCWSPAGQNSLTPWCFFSQASVSGYSLSDVTETSTGMSGKLSLIGSGSTLYGNDLKTLKLDVVYESSDIIRVKITDYSSPRWEIPESVIPRPHATSKPNSMNVKFSSTSSPFSFEIIRLSDNRSLFKADNSIVFKDQYIELSTTTDSTATTFGLGESTRLHQALTSGTTYTMWAADIAAISMDRNLYGSFPYYLQMVKGSAHGAMLMNSNGIDATVQTGKITFKTIGGIIDLYVFAGFNPSDVVSQYTSIVGRPSMMPYWSLGFHNCKYGYTSLSQVQEVVANYSAAGIPLDTQWMDIDYMQNFRDFTFDSVQFPTSDVAKFVDQLHSNGQHFVPIVDPGIMVKSNYDAYDKGVKADLFIKDITGGYYLGQVWPGPTYFPDFLHPSSQDYWTEQVQQFHDDVSIDGIWIDMNEISNFCNSDGTGQVCKNSAPNGCPAPGASQTDCCLVCSTVDSTNKYDFPPYAIRNTYGKLGTKTVAASATQYGNVTVYDSHNLYGLTEQIATQNALQTVRNKRAFLLSRSSFLSTGAHSAKWTGDNGATWDDLKSSVISLMDFNLFGVPMIGADICGFIFDTTEELCSRWIEVGAFYPFARNHNTFGAAPQELYLWDSVTAAAKNALSMRYQLLPYFYTQFYNAHVNGAMVIRSLWVNFPSDSVALTIDRQFMIGSSILISPVLDQGSTNVNAYFPAGLWYNFVDRTLSVDASSGGKYVSINTPLTSINVHIRGGSVVPLQQAAMTTTAGRATPFTLVVALCERGMASGSLFWDDGEQIELNSYISASYVAQYDEDRKAGVFSATINHSNYLEGVDVKVGTIVFLGANLRQPSSVTLNGKTLSSSQVVFDSSKSTLEFKITDLGVSIVDAIQLIFA